MRAFAEQAGVECAPGALSAVTAYDCASSRWLTADEVAASLDVQLDAFPAAVEQLSTSLGPDASAADAIEAFVASRAADTDVARRDRQALQAIVEADGASSPSPPSRSRWLWHELVYGGNYFGDVPHGGYRHLAGRDGDRSRCAAGPARRRGRGPTAPGAGAHPPTAAPRKAPTRW